MNKYEVAKELGVNLEHLEEIGKEYRETLEMMESIEVNHQSFVEWMDIQVNNISKKLDAKIELFTDMTELPFMEYIEKQVDKVLEANDKQLDYFVGVGKGKEYKEVFSVIPFSYRGMRFVLTANVDGEAWLYDVSRYGKILGMGKEKFSNITYYPEIGGEK